MKPHSEKMILILSLLAAMLLLSLGLWWLYLISHWGSSSVTNIDSMIKWEGGTFVLLISLLWITFLYQYFKERKRIQMVRDFFATMTHELKTPLSRVCLQAEVVADTAKSVPEENRKRLMDVSSRLIEDTRKLENQLDKVIQLARVERGEQLTSEIIELPSLIRNCHRKWFGEQLKISFEPSPTSEHGFKVWADEFALEIIFRNLFENTFVHGKERNVKISLVDDGKRIILNYDDGHFFSGEWDKMGSLFYKHASKGAGIGLYLIKRLMQQMKGHFKIENNPRLSFSLSFVSAKGSTLI